MLHKKSLGNWSRTTKTAYESKYPGSGVVRSIAFHVIRLCYESLGMNEIDIKFQTPWLSDIMVS